MCQLYYVPRVMPHCNCDRVSLTGSSPVGTCSTHDLKTYVAVNFGCCMLHAAINCVLWRTACKVPNYWAVVTLLPCIRNQMECTSGYTCVGKDLLWFSKNGLKVLTWSSWSQKVMTWQGLTVQTVKTTYVLRALLVTEKSTACRTCKASLPISQWRSPQAPLLVVPFRQLDVWKHHTSP